jgi:LysM repeat protein
LFFPQHSPTLRAMLKPLLRALAFLGVATAVLAQPTAADYAGLAEQVRALNEQAGQLALRVEQLERDNTRLRDQNTALTRRLDDTARATVTPAQLAAAVSELRTLVSSGDQATRDQVNAQIKKLADQTNAALDAIAKGSTPRQPDSPIATTPPVFSDNYPKDGIAYTVQSGDNIAKIAQKTGAKQADIINANKLANPSKLNAGQKLFIPGGKAPTP